MVRILMMVRCLLTACAAAVLSTALLAAAVDAATVTTIADSGPGSLRQAILNAANGDTINFAVTGMITLTSGELVISVDLTIVGPGPDMLSVKANSSRAFNIQPGASVAMSDLTIGGSLTAGTGGDGGAGGVGGAGGAGGSGGSAQGGGILNSGDLALRDCVVTGNAFGGFGGAGGAGGDGDAATPNGGDGGDAGAGGAAQGAGIYNEGSLDIVECTISGNAFGGFGGAGGAGGTGAPDGTNGGAGGNGGQGGMAGAAQGAGIYNAGSLEILDSTLRGAAFGGFGGNGGAGGDGATDTITGGDGGDAGAGGSGQSAEGAAVFSEPGANLSVRNSAVVSGNGFGGFGGSGGKGGGAGGGTVLGGDGGDGGNGGPGAGAFGGGIFASGITAVVNCTLSGNAVFAGFGATGGMGGNGAGGPGNGGDGGKGGNGGDGADGLGGALYQEDSFEQSFIYLTVARNSAFSGFHGNGGAGGPGGAGTTTPGSAGAAGADGVDGGASGAGIHGDGGSTISRSLLANNAGEALNCGGSFVSGGFNLSSDASCAAIFVQPTDLPPNTDPMLEPLALNPPGTTQTHALPAGSAALHRIPPASCIENEDQRGIFRPQGEGCDIGAYESVRLRPAPTLDGAGLLVLAGLLAGAGMLALRRRPGAASYQ